ncbi:chemotaxis protein CheR [Geobacter sp.]|uniref:class I SAM-dependent methyltransferase n=1 Tax=Geobacter sp. TaxID=46610 RepID=UPI00260F9F3A|nr:chemotaxis protein CheR [Geobacter sp.]
MEQHLTIQAPVTDPAGTERALGLILAPGRLDDPDLRRRIGRLHERFATYAATAPFALWAPGGVITPEIRSTTALLIPLVEVRAAFRRLLRLALRLDASLEGTPFRRAPSWPDCAGRLDPPFRTANPARLLEQLAADDQLRRTFLFSLFVPRRHGARFDRYPEQGAFLRRWLRSAGSPRRERLRCLDLACGAGEGSYALARLLLDAGCHPGGFRILGLSREPLEIFAAVHGLFPHDPPRQEAFRLVREELRAKGGLSRIGFATGELSAAAGDRYDIILCNGILGGPFIHERNDLEQTVAGIARRLAAGGIVLAADRFHDGWKRSVPPERIGELFAAAGLTVTAAGEGIAGIRNG